MSWLSFCKRVKEAGYHGVETPVPADQQERGQFVEALQEHGLLLIAQYYQSFEKDFDEHFRNYQAYLEDYVSVKPQLVNCQTGKDYFSAEQNGRLFALAGKVAAESGITICHETHRNKALFACHAAAALLRQFPEVKITADFSHWCCVAESLLEDQTDTMKLACDRAVHLHARVGHSQGAQVNDPRAPEWSAALNAHLVWWDKIIYHHRQAGAHTFTVTTEFGPPPYLPVLPFSAMPVANQWDINVYMKELLTTRYLPR